MLNVCYNGSIVDQRCKEQNGFYFIEELFTGDTQYRAPLPLRKKISEDVIFKVEMEILCFYGAPGNTKIAFKNYKHFQRTLSDMKINLKKYIKDEILTPEIEY